MSPGAEIKASKHEQAVLSLAAGRSAAQAAAGVGVSRRTILRWSKAREFAVRVTDSRAGLCKRSGGVWARCTTHAASRLGRLLESEDDRVALGVARSVSRTDQNDSGSSGIRRAAGVKSNTSCAQPG
jgi:hypothetical protein